MTYNPPAGNAVDYPFLTTPAYAPPAGNAVNFGEGGGGGSGVAKSSKLVGYAVLQTVGNNKASKLVGYAVLAIEATRTSKMVGYAVLKGSNSSLLIQSFTVT